MNIDLTLHVMSGNLAGESTVSHENLCWITKTHWPMMSPMGTIKFSAKKAFTVVRNPIDVIPSFAYLFNLTSHSLTTSVPLNEVDPEYWDRFVEEVATIMNKTHKTMQEQLSPAIPVYYLRYEDLILNP